MERWAPAPGFPDYEISDHGQIRRIKAGRGARAGKVLSPYTKKSGHRAILIRVDGSYKHARLARLVCQAFVAPIPFDGAETRHRDGVPNHDHWKNLEWGTSADNKADMVRHGTRRHGEDHWSARYSDDVVASIKQRYAEGWLQREIAEDLGTTQGYISRVLTGRRRGGIG
jgi:hypothetical protein